MARGYLIPVGAGTGSADVTAARAQVLAGYTAVTCDSDDEAAEGTIESMEGGWYDPRSFSQRIECAGKYMTGNISIRNGYQSGTMNKSGLVFSENGDQVLYTLEEGQNFGYALFRASVQIGGVSKGNNLRGYVAADEIDTFFMEGAVSVAVQHSRAVGQVILMVSFLTEEAKALGVEVSVSGHVLYG